VDRHFPSELLKLNKSKPLKISIALAVRYERLLYGRGFKYANLLTAPTINAEWFFFCEGK
jgi:hypothetical protein